jgi:hypothetical protein
MDEGFVVMIAGTWDTGGRFSGIRSEEALATLMFEILSAA